MCSMGIPTHNITSIHYTRYRDRDRIHLDSLYYIRIGFTWIRFVLGSDLQPTMHGGRSSIHTLLVKLAARAPHYTRTRRR
jgi:hypothetical protein